MSELSPRAAMARAFRDTTLSMVGLFQVYEAHPDLTRATAEALGRLFRRHLRSVPVDAGPVGKNPLHALVDELDDAIDDAR